MQARLFVWIFCQGIEFECTYWTYPYGDWKTLKLAYIVWKETQYFCFIKLTIIDFEESRWAENWRIEKSHVFTLEMVVFNVFFRYLNSNFLSGSIPSEIENLKILLDLYGWTLLWMSESERKDTRIDFWLTVRFFRDLHQNYLTGVVPPFISAQSVNLASNFFVGNIPKVFPYTTSDFRFNYFDNCNESCCLFNEKCTQSCLFLPENSNDPLPLGVEYSVWTELNVTLLGVEKRIIQIETRFDSSPHLLRSYACPYVSTLDSCNNFQASNQMGAITGSILLETNASFPSSQTSNSFQKYQYFIQGDVCATNVKVSFHEGPLPAILTYNLMLDYCSSLHRRSWLECFFWGDSILWKSSWTWRSDPLPSSFISNDWNRCFCI